MFIRKLFEIGIIKKMTKSETIIQKGLKERIRNYIIRVPFLNKITVNKSNLLLRGYLYKYFKQLKMQNHVKIITSK